MRKFIYSLFLTVLLGIPLSANATIVDDPDVFNFAPFYDPSSGVVGLSLTFFPSEEGDTVYIPDYIYEIISTNMFLSLYSIFIVYNK